MSENNQKIKIMNNNTQNIFFGIFNDDPGVIGNKLSRPETPFYKIKENFDCYLNIKQASQENLDLAFEKINEFSLE